MYSISANSLVGRYQDVINSYCNQKTLKPGEKILSVWLIPVISCIGTAILGSLDLAICFIALPIYCSVDHLKNLAAAVTIVILAPFCILANLVCLHTLPSIDYLRPYLCFQRTKTTALTNEVPVNSPLVNDVNSPLAQSTYEPLPRWGSEETTLASEEFQITSYDASIISLNGSPISALISFLEADFQISEEDRLNTFKYLLNSIADINQIYQGSTLLKKICTKGLLAETRELLKRKPLFDENFYVEILSECDQSTLPQILMLLLDYDKARSKNAKPLLAQHKFEVWCINKNPATDFSQIEPTRDSASAEVYNAEAIRSVLKKTSFYENLFIKAVLVGQHSLAKQLSLSLEPYLPKSKLEMWRFNKSKATLFSQIEPMRDSASAEVYNAEAIRSVLQKAFKKAVIDGQLSLAKQLSPYLDWKTASELAVRLGLEFGHWPIVNEYLSPDRRSREEAFCKACENGQDKIVAEFIKNGIGPELIEYDAGFHYTVNEVFNFDAYSYSVSKALHPLYLAFFAGNNKPNIDKVVSILLENGLSIPMHKFVYRSQLPHFGNRIPSEVLNSGHQELFDWSSQINQCVSKLRTAVIPIFAGIPKENFIFPPLYNIVFDYLACTVENQSKPEEREPSNHEEYMEQIRVANEKWSKEHEEWMEQSRVANEKWSKEHEEGMEQRRAASEKRNKEHEEWMKQSRAANEKRCKEYEEWRERMREATSLLNELVERQQNKYLVQLDLIAQYNTIADYLQEVISISQEGQAYPGSENVNQIIETILEYSILGADEKRSI